MPAARSRAARSTSTPNQGFSVRITSPTTAATCGTVSNTANVTATNEDPAGTAPNSATDSVQVQCPDVTVEKSTTTPEINSGDPANFIIVVSNNGPGTATNVTVTDPLPDGVDWDTTTPGCAITPDPATTGQTLNCTFASLAPGAAFEITIVVSSIVPETFCGPLTNLLVTVDAGNEANTGPAAANNTAGPVTITVNCPDLTITKEPDAGDPGSVINAGDTATFTITVDNIGAGTATNVTVSDNLPDGINWNTPAAGCSIDPPSGTVGQVLTCNLGDIEPGDDPIVITVTGVTDAADCGELENTATVAAANEPETALDNNSDTATIIVECPNISIEKTADTSPINAGETASYTITVTNAGPGTAFDVTVEDTLPPGEWTVATDTGTCDTPATGSFSCALGDLADDQVVTITVSRATTAADCATLTNLAVADASNDDPDEDSADIVVDCPDLEVVKTAASEPVSAGDPASFTITVTNNGQGTAFGVDARPTPCRPASSGPRRPDFRRRLRGRRRRAQLRPGRSAGGRELQCHRRGRHRRRRLRPARKPGRSHGHQRCRRTSSPTTATRRRSTSSARTSS